MSMSPIRAARVRVLSPDSDPRWVWLYMQRIGERWAATILADTAAPPAPGELKGLTFFADTPEEVERLAVEYLGEGVAEI